MSTDLGCDPSVTSERGGVGKTLVMAYGEFTAKVQSTEATLVFL